MLIIEAGGTVGSGSGSGAVAIVSRTVEQVTVDGRKLDVVRSFNGRGMLVDNSVSSNLSAVPQGLSAFFLRPFIWEGGSGNLRWAAVEGLGWVVLYLFALRSSGRMWVQHRGLFVFGSTWLLGIGGVASMTQGNLGTAFRHRGQILWLVVVMACVGGEQVVNRRRRLELQQ
jgi:hypothetical protein